MALATVNIPNVEVFATGDWNGDTYTQKDLDEMVAASQELPLDNPVKIGHVKDGKFIPITKDFAAPAVGWVENLRRVGTSLYGDLMHVPKKVAELIESKAYRKRSAEIYWDYKGQDGKVYPRVFKALAILGADMPAVTTLDDCIALYESDEENVHIYAFPPGTKAPPFGQEKKNCDDPNCTDPNCTGDHSFKDNDPNVGGGVDRDKLSAGDFAGKNRSFPIVTPGDVSDAASSIGRAGPGNYSPDQLKSRIISIAKRKGPSFVAQLPAAWTNEKKNSEETFAEADLDTLIGEIERRAIGEKEGPVVKQLCDQIMETMGRAVIATPSDGSEGAQGAGAQGEPAATHTTSHTEEGDKAVKAKVYALLGLDDTVPEDKALAALEDKLKPPTVQTFAESKEYADMDAKIKAMELERHIERRSAAIGKSQKEGRLGAAVEVVSQWEKDYDENPDMTVRHLNALPVIVTFGQKGSGAVPGEIKPVSADNDGDSRENLDKEAKAYMETHPEVKDYAEAVRAVLKGAA